MIARLRAALLRWLIGPPCGACSLPCPPAALEDHLQWHRTEALMAGRPAPPEPRRGDLLPPPPRPENGGPR